jgi:hypothetical protein
MWEQNSRSYKSKGAGMNRDDINKLANWMIAKGYATGHGETMEDLLAELDWQIAESWNRAMINGITTEREAIAQVIENEKACSICGFSPKMVAATIRARGKNV